MYNNNTNYNLQYTQFPTHSHIPSQIPPPPQYRPSPPFVPVKIEPNSTGIIGHWVFLWTFYGDYWVYIYQINAMGVFGYLPGCHGFTGNFYNICIPLEWITSYITHTI